MLTKLTKYMNELHRVKFLQLLCCNRMGAEQVYLVKQWNAGNKTATINPDFQTDMKLIPCVMIKLSPPQFGHEVTGFIRFL